MAMSPEDMQVLIDESRIKLQEDKQRQNGYIKDVQANPPVTQEELREMITQPGREQRDDEGVLDYVADEVMDIGSSAVGAVELGAEFTTGMFAAFAGTVVGTAKEVADDPLGFLPGPINIALSSLVEKDTMKKHGKFFMETFQDYTEAMTYQPRTVQGQALSHYAQQLFGKFQDWGEQAGDAVLEETGSPLIATAVETAITGAPVYVPFIGGKILQRRADKAKLERRRELIDEGFDTPLDPTAINQSMLPDPRKIASTPVDRLAPDVQSIQNKTAQAKQDKQLKDLEKQVRDPNQKTLDLEEFPRINEDAATPHPDRGRKISTSEAVSRAKKVDQIQDASIIASGRRDIPSVRQVKDLIMETTFDASAGLRRRILSGNDKTQNRLLELEHNKQSGATPKAQIDYIKSENKIYTNLAREDGILLDKFINSLRTIQVDLNAALKKQLPPKHSGNRTGVDHKIALAVTRKRIGEDKYNMLMKRADDYFRVHNRLLGDLFVEGLITKKQHNSMKGDIYSPRKFLENVDPLNESLTAGTVSFDIFGKRVKLNDSGLRELNKGSLDLMEMNSKLLLQEVTVRITARIWRNQSNVMLLDWVKKNPDNGWVRVAKEGEKAGKKGSIDAYIDGRKATMLVDKGMALQWVGNTYVMGHGFSSFLRTLSGQTIMKPLTTGMNPEFALKLFGLDIVHAHFATDVFSPSAPIYSLQLGKNLAVTMKDAFFKGDRFEAYINEGGGMNFLTHQGTDALGGKGVIRSNTTWRKTKTALSFLNEGFEIWVRLAIQERSIAIGKSPSEAALIAREYIDFSQGGTFSKSIDTVFPYFNPVLQSVRSISAAATRGDKSQKVLGLRKRFLYQVAELSAYMGAWAMYQELHFPEVMRQLPTEEKAKFFIFPVGRGIRNKQGEVQYAYVKIRKDNVVAALINPAEMAVRNIITGEVPDDQTLAYFKSASPVLPAELSTPTGGMLHTFTYNHDFWGNPVWNNPDLDAGVSPEDEFTGHSVGKEQSSVFFRDVGKALGMAPERLEAAMGNIAPSNGYLDFGGFAYKKIVDQMLMGNPEDPFLAEQVFEQQLTRAPFLRKMISLTHPAYRVMEDSKEPRTKSQVLRKNQGDNLDSLIANNTSFSTVKQWVRQQKPEDQKRLLTSYITRTELHKIFNGKTEMSLNVPGPFFWNHVASEIKDNEEKAEVLYWEWKKMPTPQDRNKFDRIMKRLSVDKQILPGTTLKHFRIMQQRWGTEGIMTSEDGGTFHMYGKRHYMKEMRVRMKQQEDRKQQAGSIDQSLLPDIP
ncbi:MAG: hypothetical protein COA94_04815 [Rickettsiales bacterium]|nr:MAG: hypothetical protein COA94_04815 [Rickettsiales bacterium]